MSDTPKTPESPEPSEPSAAPSPEPPPPAENLRDEHGRIYATGKRKNSIARVWLKPGTGKITINGKLDSIYFGRSVLKLMVRQSFQVIDRESQYDVQCTVRGGGLSGQAGAIRHGIARCLALDMPEAAKTLKTAGFLTRDTRIVERKKYGRRKARRGFQFSKR